MRAQNVDVTCITRLMMQMCVESHGERKNERLAAGLMPY